MLVAPLRSSLCAEDSQQQLSVLALWLWEQGPDMVRHPPGRSRAAVEKFKCDISRIYPLSPSLPARNHMANCNLQGSRSVSLSAAADSFPIPNLLCFDKDMKW